MLLRNVVCSIALLVIVWGYSEGLAVLRHVMSFGGYMTFCAVGVALMVTAAFAFDWHQARSRSQR